MNVVRNRYCEDSVGCKIVVPESVSDTLTSDDFWPENIVSSMEQVDKKHIEQI